MDGLAAIHGTFALAIVEAVHELKDSCIAPAVPDTSIPLLAAPIQAGCLR